MRKSNLIPKICAAVVFLIVAIIISAPVTSVTMNRIFGGGIVEFSKAGSAEYLENRPVEGVLEYIIGCSSGESSDDFTLKNGSYYYLVSLRGRTLEKGKEEDVILLRTNSSSDSYEELNDLFRGKKNDYALAISGVIKKATANEEKIAEQISKDSKVKDVKYVSYCIDCSKPVSSYTARFFISLIFYAGCVVSVLLSVQTVKRNRDIDDMEHRRAIMQASRERQENDANANGADALFGDADRSFATENTQFQGEGQSPIEVAQNLEQQAAMQSQNNDYRANQNSFSQDDGFFGEKSEPDNKYDGFFGS